MGEYNTSLLMQIITIRIMKIYQTVEFYVKGWSDVAQVDSFCLHGEACSKASRLTPPRWLNPCVLFIINTQSATEFIIGGR